MYCKKCGEEIPGGAAFCKKCGTAVTLKEEKTESVSALVTPDNTELSDKAKEVGRRILIPAVCAVLLVIVIITAMSNMIRTKDYKYYTYTLWGNEVIITGYEKDAVKLVIPKKIKGMKVTKIGDNAFSGCSSLKEITIPDSVTEIGESAFENCSSLEKITMPDTTEIGWLAFSGCYKLGGYAGIWEATKASAAGPDGNVFEMDASDIYENFTLELIFGGQATVNLNGEEGAEFEWKEVDGGIVVDDMTFRDEGGKLVMVQSGATIVFEKQ